LKKDGVRPGKIQTENFGTTSDKVLKREMGKNKEGGLN
jgi:hypothetical protein